MCPLITWDWLPNTGAFWLDIVTTNHPAGIEYPLRRWESVFVTGTDVMLGKTFRFLCILCFLTCIGDTELHCVGFSFSVSCRGFVFFAVEATAQLAGCSTLSVSISNCEQFLKLMHVKLTSTLSIYVDEKCEIVWSFSIVNEPRWRVGDSCHWTFKN